MKKALKVLLIIVISIVVIIGLVFGGLYFNNKSKLKSEESKIIQYGEKISVKDKHMQVYIQGQGEQTIVMLPGYLTGAPKIDFQQLTDELAQTYRVVVIEPFGYGLSDDTDEVRSVENLVSEVHTVLDTLQIKEYALVTHSIWGVYALKYIETYPTEVTAQIGIDSSLPSQGGAEDNQGAMIGFLSKSGIYRVLANSDDNFITTPPVDEASREQFKYISLRNIGSQATLNEGEEMLNNFNKTKDIKYPTNLPVLYLLASESINDDSNWVPIHEEMLKNSEKGKIVTLDGSHYLHHTQSKAIAAEIESFIGK